MGSCCSTPVKKVLTVGPPIHMNSNANHHMLQRIRPVDAPAVGQNNKAAIKSLGL
jgi:hypothetical protein